MSISRRDVLRSAAMVGALALSPSCVLGNRGYHTIGHEVLALEHHAGSSAGDYTAFDELLTEIQNDVTRRRDRFAGRYEGQAQDTLDHYIDRQREDVALFTAERDEDESRASEGGPLEELYTSLAQRNDKLITSIREEVESKIFFQSVSHTLERMGYRYKSERDDVLLLGEAIENKELDCDTASMIYVSAGERTENPVRFVLLPDHAFMRWDPERDHVPFEEGRNFDPIGASLSDATQAEAYNRRRRLVDPVLTENVLAETVYLRSLSREETRAVGYYNVGRWLDEQGRAEEADDHFRKAAASSPRWPDPLYYLKDYRKWAEVIVPEKR